MTLFEDGATVSLLRVMIIFSCCFCSQNRLEESLNLFQAIHNHKFFKKTLMVYMPFGETHSIYWINHNKNNIYYLYLCMLLSACSCRSYF